MASFLRKLDGGLSSTAWHSTHPGSAQRAERLASMSASLASAHDRRITLLSLAPSPLKDGGEGGIGVIGASWSLVPSRLQEAMLTQGLWLVASLLQHAWELLQAAARGEQTRSPRRSPPPSRPRADPCVDCTDCESKISFETVRAGSYVRLGYGQCLSREDVQDLHRTGQLQLNPYTRQPFTTAQKRDIETLLDGRSVRYYL